MITTSVIPVAAKKKILKAVMPKGREVAEDLREFMTVDFSNQDSSSQ